MEILKIFLMSAELILFVYLGLAAIYFLLFAVASHFYKEPVSQPLERQYSVAILILAYREDSVIIETALSALKHQVSRGKSDIYVIADQLKPETMKIIRKSGAGVIPVSFDQSTKAKSLNYAMNVMAEDYDYALILDADNIMVPGFVDQLLEKAEQGFRIVQGHRTAKNSNTRFASLDGISEEVNNSIFRRGHRTIGLSAALIGSGFICDFKLFRTLMLKVEAVGGFDKELELLLLKNNNVIGYCQNAIVYDEKVQMPDAFINQRRRWLSAQFIYFGNNIGEGFVQLFKFGNFDFFDKLIQFLLPPRIITIGLSFAVAFINLLLLFSPAPVMPSLFFYSYSGLFIISALAVLISIPASKFDMSMLKSLFTLPYAFILTMVAQLKIKGANKRFIHTTHGIR